MKPAKVEHTVEELGIILNALLRSASQQEKEKVANGKSWNEDDQRELDATRCLSGRFRTLIERHFHVALKGEDNARP